MRIKFKPPRFYPIIDTAVLRQTPFAALDVAQAAGEAGVRILQYRHKEAWTQVQFDEAQAIAELCQTEGIQFILNDRADFARLLNAGLHIGQDDLPPIAARSVVTDAVIGFSTHDALQLRYAAEAPVDYLSLGPMFATRSKLRPDPTVGIDGLKALRALAAKPLVAIGGITLATAQQVLEAGADSVAIISAILPSSNTLQDLSSRLLDWVRLTGSEVS